MANNYVTLTGRLGEPPILRFVPTTGHPATEFSMAYQRRKADPENPGSWLNGETHWFRITAYRKAAEMVSRLPAGSLVRINGQLIQQSWQDEEGKQRSMVKVQADSIDLCTNGLVDIEGQRGELHLRWGRPKPEVPEDDGDREF